VIYDSTVPEGTEEGVYIQAKAYKLEYPKDIESLSGYIPRSLLRSYDRG
jgi:hypothetical protein